MIHVGWGGEREQFPVALLPVAGGSVVAVSLNGEVGVVLIGAEVDEEAAGLFATSNSSSFCKKFDFYSRFFWMIIL